MTLWTTRPAGTLQKREALRLIVEPPLQRGKSQSVATRFHAALLTHFVPKSNRSAIDYFRLAAALRHAGDDAGTRTVARERR